MIKIGLIGGTGYTGVELLRLLVAHPQADLMALSSRGKVGGMYTEITCFGANYSLGTIINFQDGSPVVTVEQT